MPDETRTILLTTPVTPYGEQVTEVQIRKPTPAELRQCGQPYVVVGGAGTGGVKADYVACAALLTLVCTPPLTSMAVDQLDPADFDELSMLLVGFTQRGPRGATANGSAPKA